jgi:hypothetical protein
MNWVFTRSGAAVRFERGEPFCHIIPVRRGELEAFAPEVRRLSEAPDIERQYETWKEGRNQFNADLRQPGSGAQAERWQKLYYRGVDAEARAAPIGDHRTRLRLKPFAKASRATSTKE